MRKKILMLVIVVIMTATPFGTLSGCKNNDYDFRVWYPKMSSEYNNLIDTPVFQELEKRTGVKARYIIEDSTKLSTLFEQKDFPEVVVQVGPNSYPGGLDAGVRDGNFIDLKPYIDLYAPNYKALMESDLDIYRECFVNDDKVGAMFAITNDVQGPWYGYLMRKDILDEFKIAYPNPGWESYPETYAEWEQFLMWTKINKSGFTYPLLLSEDGLDVFENLNAGFNVGRSFYQANGTVKYGPSEDAFKEYVDLMRSWYAKKLIAPDFNAISALSSLSEMVGNSTSDGKYAVFPFVYTNITSFEETAKMLRPNTKYELIAVPAPVKEKGQALHLRQANSHTGMCISITKNCPEEKIEQVMKWIDYFYSEEGRILFNYGIEGDTFTYVDGVPKYTDKIVNNPGVSMTNALYKYVAHSWTFNVYWQREFEGLSTKAIEAIDVWQSNNDAAYTLPSNISLNKEESQTVTNKMASISTFVAEQVPLYIINENNKFASYDSSFKANLSTMGIDTVIAAYQSALNRYLAREL